MRANLFTPFQCFSLAFHYLFSLQNFEKLRVSSLLHLAFSLFAVNINTVLKKHWNSVDDKHTCKAWSIWKQSLHLIFFFN
jgi:hypothetical protein